MPSRECSRVRELRDHRVLGGVEAALRLTLPRPALVDRALLAPRHALAVRPRGEREVGREIVVRHGLAQRPRGGDRRGLRSRRTHAIVGRRPDRAIAPRGDDRARAPGVDLELGIHHVLRARARREGLVRLVIPDHHEVPAVVVVDLIDVADHRRRRVVHLPGPLVRERGEVTAPVQLDRERPLIAEVLRPALAPGRVDLPQPRREILADPRLPGVELDLRPALPPLVRELEDPADEVHAAVLILGPEILERPELDRRPVLDGREALRDPLQAPVQEPSLDAVGGSQRMPPQAELELDLRLLRVDPLEPPVVLVHPLLGTRPVCRDLPVGQELLSLLHALLLVGAVRL